jgi:hypothetical protein
MNALERTCPRCGAQPGQRCRGPNGKTTHIHSPRRSPNRPQPVGRDTLLTPELTKNITQQLELGVPAVHAAQANGISYPTLMRWIANADDPSPAYDACRVFREEVARARARASARHVTLVNKAAQGGYTVKTRTITHVDGTREVEETKAAVDWRASAFILERNFPREFGRREVVELAQADGLVPQPGGDQSAMVLDSAGLDRLADRLAMFRERRALGSPGEQTIQGEVAD